MAGWQVRKHEHIMDLGYKRKTLRVNFYTRVIKVTVCLAMSVLLGCRLPIAVCHLLLLAASSLFNAVTDIVLRTVSV